MNRRGKKRVAEIKIYNFFPYFMLCDNCDKTYFYKEKIRQQNVTLGKIILAVSWVISITLKSECATMLRVYIIAMLLEREVLAHLELGTGPFFNGFTVFT